MHTDWSEQHSDYWGRTIFKHLSIYYVEDVYPSVKGIMVLKTTIAVTKLVNFSVAITQPVDKTI